MQSVLLLLLGLTLVASQDWWGTNDIGCIEGHIPTADENVPLHLSWARFLADRVFDGTGNSTYDHVAGPIYWGGYSCNAYFTSVSDCNGFTSAFFKQAYNLTIDSPPGYNHAYASTYWHAFVDQTFGFERILRVQDIKVGDVIAYNYLYGLDDTLYLGTQNSGHIGLVNKVPVVATPVAPIIPDTIQWAVNVIDQTSDPHWITDYRYNISATGLGNGNMRLYTSASNGSFVGYVWSFSTASIFYYQNVIRSAAFGRLSTAPQTGCGVSISQTLINSWVAGYNPGTPYTQWSVNVYTSNKEVKSLQLLIVLPAGSVNFSSWQIQAVAGHTGVYTIVDWHFASGQSLPTNYQHNFGYTLDSKIAASVYVLSSTC